MTKQLIIGLATIAVTGVAILATGMYASTDWNNISNTTQMDHMRMNTPQDMITTLSGKVSPEALTALQTLMTKHKSEMDAIHANTGNIPDTATMEKQRETFKTEMDALLSQYPELKTTMPMMNAWGMMGRNNWELEAIISTLPTDIQTELKAIHDEYKTKQDALRTEEKTKIDAILAKYPEIKTKLDAIEKNHPWKMEWRGQHGEWRGMGNMMNR